MPSGVIVNWTRPEEDTADRHKQNVWLFNVAEDPEERHDLSESNPSKLKEMLDRLEEYRKTSAPVFYPAPDPRSNPALHGGVWGPWE